MSLQSPRPAGPPLIGSFLLNLPVALLFCAVYFLLFSLLWGPPRPWKWILAASLVPALALGLDLRGLGSRRRRKRAPGSRGAEARARWPWWRRVGAIYAGALLSGIGIYQSLGIEVDIALVPLISGLCLITSLGIGIPLVVVAWPREAWRRSPRRRRPPARERKVGSLLPGEEDTGKGTSLHVPTPQARGYSGLWGGIGSGPTHRVWTPGGSSRAATDEPAPARFRKLRLFRKADARRTRATAPGVTMAVGLIVLGAIALLVYGCVVS